MGSRAQCSVQRGLMSTSRPLAPGTLVQGAIQVSLTKSMIVCGQESTYLMSSAAIAGKASLTILISTKATLSLNTHWNIHKARQGSSRRDLSKPAAHLMKISQAYAKFVYN